MVVLDTHAVVWWASDPGRLSAKAAAIIDKTDCGMSARSIGKHGRASGC